MCGIFGYIGPKNAVEICLAGIKRLEYRGYDSSGIAGIRNGELLYCKEVGKIARMEEKVNRSNLELSMAITHTRWATHGQPSEANAHPHTDENETLALVHNGIIENHEALRARLIGEGVKFRSETDTEVVAQLIGWLYRGDLLKAVQEAVAQLKGSWALAVIHKDHPGEIVVAAFESPLAIGVGDGESFIASDTNAFLVHTRQVAYMNRGEVAVVTADGFRVYNERAAQVLKETEQVTAIAEEVGKGAYDHYMLKEIFEQPQTIRNALLARYVEDLGNACLDGLTLSIEELLAVRRILILACGTSFHAGLVAGYLIEEMARVPVQVEISSEFRYKNPIIERDTLVIAISQSGETADTLAAMREVQAKGAVVIAICNAQGSTIAREADCTLLLRAGPEIGVASTKAFTSQLTVLALFSLYMARMRHMDKSEGLQFLQALRLLPDQVEQILRRSAEIEHYAKKYAKFENFFFLGRHYMYPTCLEGALKLKEISYLNANGYPAGEMKHGPIALIGPSCPTVACCANQLTIEKMLSNLKEVQARSGPILAIAQEGTEGLESITSDVITVPRTLDPLACILTTVVTQLFAYYMARELGCEIDQPRNLAKSVTVE
jgi:glutamine---fructose-6-phosphate transaminase (isomerizing)